MTDDIELVIKIPKEKYDAIKSYSVSAKMKECFRLAGPALEAIRNGIPLPKGHGKLKDVDDLDVTTVETDDYDGNEILDVVLKEDIDEADTIIPADTESEDKEDGGDSN